MLPLLTERVATTEDKEMVGSRQIEMLLQDDKLPFGRDLTVEVGDSSYSKPAYLHAHRNFPNLVTMSECVGIAPSTISMYPQKRR